MLSSPNEPQMISENPTRVPVSRSNSLSSLRATRLRANDRRVRCIGLSGIYASVSGMAAIMRWWRALIRCSAAVGIILVSATAGLRLGVGGDHLAPDFSDGRVRVWDVLRR